jgi:hypothetical protein
MPNANQKKEIIMTNTAEKDNATETVVFKNPFEDCGRLLTVDLKEALNSGHLALGVLTDIKSALQYALSSCGGSVFRKNRSSSGNDPTFNMLYIGSTGDGALELYFKRSNTDTALIGIKYADTALSEAVVIRGADILQDYLAHHLGISGYAVGLVDTENKSKAIAILRPDNAKAVFQLLSDKRADLKSWGSEIENLVSPDFQKRSALRH